MKVNEISKINFMANVNKVKKVRKVDQEVTSDKVELSREAKALKKAHSNLSEEKIAQISKRIRENYYDQDKVLNVVAERILKSPKFKALIQGNKLDKNL